MQICKEKYVVWREGGTASHESRKILDISVLIYPTFDQNICQFILEKKNI